MRNVILSAAVLGVFGIGCVQAATVAPNGSFSGAFVVTSAVSTGVFLIGTGTTSIDVPSPGLTIDAVDPYLGLLNNMVDVNGGSVTADLFVGSPINISMSTLAIVNGPVLFDVTFGSYTFSFTSESVISKTDGNIGLLFLGNLTTDTVGRLTTPAPADFSLTFTQSSPTASIGTAFSIDTPPNLSLVPEPAGIALFGIGLLGFGLVRRRG